MGGCIHDANHSVALFLKTKGECQFAFHNYIPFTFAGSNFTDFGRGTQIFRKTHAYYREFLGIFNLPKV